ncbi:MAG: hypothetical protein ACPGLV_17660, partial [Bacteroidia bacterium]
MSAISFEQINTPEVWANEKIEKVHFFLDPKINPEADVELREFSKFNIWIIFKTLGTVLFWYVIINAYFNSKDAHILLYSVVPLVFTVVVFFNWKKLLKPKTMNFDLNGKTGLQIIKGKDKRVIINDVDGVMLLNHKLTEFDTDGLMEATNGYFILVRNKENKWFQLFKSTAKCALEWSKYLAHTMQVPLRIDRVDIDNTIPLQNPLEVVQNGFEKIKGKQGQMVSKIINGVEKLVPFDMLNKPILRKNLEWEFDYYQSVVDTEISNRLLTDLSDYNKWALS